MDWFLYDMDLCHERVNETDQLAVYHHHQKQPPEVFYEKRNL